MRHPVVVWPLWRDKDDTSWITVSEHLLWLRRVVCAQGSTKYKRFFQAAVTALRQDVKTQIEQAANPLDKARSELQLDEDDAANAEACPAAARGGKRKKPLPSEKTVQVEIDGVSAKAGKHTHA